MIYQTTVWLEDMILVSSGDIVKHRDNLFATLERLQEAGCKASEKKSEIFLKETTWLGQQIVERRLKPEEEKKKVILQKRPPTSSNEKIFHWSNTISRRSFAQFFEKNQSSETTAQKKRNGIGLKEKKEDFNEIKRKITDIPCVTRFFRYRYNIVTTDASETGLGISVWHTLHVNTIYLKLFTSSYLNDAEMSYSIGELELLAVV